MLPTEEDIPGPASTRRRSDTVLAVLAAAATMAFAWSGFQSAEWIRVRFLASDEAASLSEQSVEVSADADRLEERDSAFYIEWRLALQAGDQATADVIYDLLRPALQQYIELAPTAADGLPAAPPFDDPEYDANEARAEASLLDAQSDELSDESREASKNAARHGGVGVLFASVLAAVGIASRFDEPRTRRALTALAAVLFVAGLLYLVASPLSFSAPPVAD